jgi:signal transduction histidine kinase
MSVPNANSTDQRRAELAERYGKELRSHLDRTGPDGTSSAIGLGRAAVAGGFTTLDLALMHEEAVVGLAPSHDFANTGNGSIRRACIFLSRALRPLEEAQTAIKVAASELRAHNEELDRSARELSRSNLVLKREVDRRKRGERKIRQAKDRYQLLLAESQVMHKRLQDLTRQLILSQEEERREISRELHDGVVQTLVGINVQLSALSKGASVGVKALKTRIARTQRLVEDSVKSVHRFARELRPAALDDLGLIPALHAYSKVLAARKSLKIHMTAFAGVEALGADKRTVLYRVAQEALTNVARHAQATKVRLSLSEVSGRIRMDISDNGRSFDVAAALRTKNHRRLGLIGMRERIEMVGGSLSIESVRGRGTTVRAEIPFTSKGNGK